MKLTGAVLLIVVYFAFIATEVTSHIYGKSIRHLNHQWKKREAEEIECTDSKLIANLATKATYLKIVTDDGDMLLNIDSTKTDIGDLGVLLTFIFAPELELQQRKIPKFIISKRPSGNGIKVRIANYWNNTILEKEIQGSNERIKDLDAKCVRVTEFKVTLDPTLDLSHRDSYNMTPLLWAGLFGDEELAKNLIERGAKVNSNGRYVTLALMSAVDAGKDTLLEYLINGGANVNEAFVDGVTALHIAARKGQLKCARVLLNHGANVSSQDLTFGGTPLHYASVPMKGSPSGPTPLQLAGQIEMVKELVAKGADVQARTKQGMTTLHIAAATGNEDLTDYFIKSGVDINSTNKANVSPLSLVVEVGTNEDKCLKMVKHLVEHHNADVNIKDNNGYTALSWANRKGFNKVQDYLKAHGAM